MLAVIFDMDGLMFATENLYMLGWIEVGKKHGWPITKELCDAHTGVSLWRTREIMTEHLGPSFDFDIAYKGLTDFLYQWIGENGIPVKPGLLELLTWLDDHEIKHAIASSSDRSMVDYYISNARDAALAERLKNFHAIVTGEQIKRSKPEPDIFFEAARQLGTAPRDCVVLEDSYNGIKAAHAANMIPVMIPDLLPPTPEIMPLVYKCVDDLMAVIPVLEKIIQEQRHE